MINIIRRNTPEIASSFVLETIEKENEKSVYSISVRGTKIVLGGDCKVSQAMAYYRYLRDYYGVSISHCGNTGIPEITEVKMPDKEIRFVIEQDKRVYMTPQTFGYSCAWWGWDEWEKEIEFMAMNGINMPLCLVGSEAVWFYTMREFKYSENGALRYLSGPAFWPWQVMGNLVSYFPLADKAYIDARLELGQKIIKRMTELGMIPILPGYAGAVPRSIGKLFRTARMTMMPPWNNFPATTIIDPSDPLFRKFGMALLEKQRQLFGAYHYYACDPFIDNRVNSKKKDYLWRFGRAIDNLYKDFDKDSVWVMQSCALREKMVKSVPNGRLLILDNDGDMAEQTEGFWGHDFICGNILNHGDRNVLYGSLDALAENKYTQTKKNYPNVCGAGLFPEGIMQNPLLFDLAFTMLTQNDKLDVDAYLADYAYRRYGSDESCLTEALKALHESCYSPACIGPETGSIICARPSTKLKHAAPGDTLELRYDNARLLDAVTLLLKSEKACTDGYIYDVCDITRQVLSNHLNKLYGKVMDAYYSKNVNEFERSTNLFLKIMEELDALLLTRPELTLSGNLTRASACAMDDKEKQNFELNLLSQVTIWGPMGRPLNYDYAWKEWGGMLDGFYAKRWHSFFEQLAVFFKKRSFTTETRKQINERNAYAGSKLYKNYEEFEKNWLKTFDPPKPIEADTLAEASKLVAKYEKMIRE